MKEQQSFLVYHDWEFIFEALESDTQRGALIAALFAYHKRGNAPQFADAALRMAFKIIQNQLDRDREKYDQMIKARAEGGAKGGRPPKNLKVSEESSRFSEKAKKPDTDTDTDTVTDTDTDTDTATDTDTDTVTVTVTATDTDTATATDTPPPPPTPPDAKSITPKAETGRGTGRTILSRFDEFWEAYPKKAGINEAKRAFLQLGVTDGLLSEMLEAIRRQVGSEQWTRDGGRFIPYPATWLSRGQWKDVPLLRRSGAASGDSGGSHSHGVSGGSGAASGYYGAAGGGGTQGGGGTIGGIAGFEAIHGGGGFDTDSFYAAALRRSYGDLCEELSCLPSVKPKDAG